MKRGQRSGHSTRTLDALQRVARARVLAPRLRRELRAGRGVELARDAVDAEAVGPVRCDLQLEHVRIERDQDPASGDPGSIPSAARSSSSTMMPAWSVPIAELVLREDHPLGGDAAELSRPRARCRRRPRARAARRRRSGRLRRSGRRRRSSRVPRDARCRDRPRRPAGGRRRDAAAPRARGRRRSARARPRRARGSPRPSCRSSSGAPRSRPHPAGGRSTRAATRAALSSGAHLAHPNCARKRRSFSK